jgi:ATP-dependent RNA helicase DeaD
MAGFADLGLSSETLDALGRVGYDAPTPIQEQAIPVMLQGRDVIGQAQTGTGKTAAFGLPMIEAVDPSDTEVQALVLTPTRELCIQVAQSLRAYGAVRGVNVLATFGGAPIRSQMDRLKAGPQVVVGTVGRVLDLMSRHSLVLHSARFVVLDEADEMLDLGFLEDVEHILLKCPSGRQTALFSATMPPPIQRLAEKFLYHPEVIKVKAPTLTIDTVEHFRVDVKPRDKAQALVDVLEAERPQQAIVFVRTKIGADRLTREVERVSPRLRVRALHGDMSQGARDGVMISFKEGRIPTLVATDIAARGLDVEHVTHVINYDLPNSAEIYTHRIGRTGRIGRSGRAITLVEPRDRDDIVVIEKRIGVELKQWQAGERFKPGLAAPAGESEPEQVQDATGVDLAAAMPEPVASGDDEGRAAEPPPEDGPKPERRKRRPRHVKPHQETLDDDYSVVLVNVGSRDGLEPADVFEMFTKHTGLDTEKLRRVRVLERFSLAHVPAELGDTTASALSGAFAGDKKLVAEAVRIATPDGNGDAAQPVTDDEE